MARSRQPKRPRPGDLEAAPETRAVRLPAYEEPFRGERQDQIEERDPGALKEPGADATGEGNVSELAEDSDGPDIPELERNAQKTEPRVKPHPHGSSAKQRRPKR
jgi:hypothetical protein